MDKPLNLIYIVYYIYMYNCYNKKMVIANPVVNNLKKYKIKYNFILDGFGS